MQVSLSGCYPPSFLLSATAHSGIDRRTNTGHRFNTHPHAHPRVLYTGANRITNTGTDNLLLYRYTNSIPDSGMLYTCTNSTTHAGTDTRSDTGTYTGGRYPDADFNTFTDIFVLYSNTFTGTDH